jgi:iron complex transport system permease protein
MKITLNLDKLLAQGRITESEYHHLKSLAETETSNLGLNILIGFGVLATTLGALALFPSPLIALQLGFILAALGIYLKLQRERVWGLLALILILLGTLLTAGGVITLTEGNVTGFLIITILCLAGGILAKSKLLAMFSALSLSATIGAMTAYGFASYYLIIQEPSLTILLFTILGWGSYQLSRKIPTDYEDIAIVFARTCLFLVNFGFWVGSLWGDENISRLVFVIGWALALIIAAIWAIRQEKRWVVNTLTVFGAIHFYTQYFERLGANPTSLMLAGILALVFAVLIFKYNRNG